MESYGVDANKKKEDEQIEEYSEDDFDNEFDDVPERSDAMLESSINITNLDPNAAKGQKTPQKPN